MSQNYEQHENEHAHDQDLHERSPIHKLRDNSHESTTRGKNLPRTRNAFLAALALGGALLAGGIAYTFARSAGNPPNQIETTITFDGLGGGSNVIMVYPGAGNTPQDEAYDGTYLVVRPRKLYAKRSAGQFSQIYQLVRKTEYPMCGSSYRPHRGSPRNMRAMYMLI